jgi:hypothetical protein
VISAFEEDDAMRLRSRNRTDFPEAAYSISAALSRPLWFSRLAAADLAHVFAHVCSLALATFSTF